MKNKIVKQLLMTCLTGALVVSMPSVTFANGTDEQIENTMGNATDDFDTLEITKENATPVIYDENDIKIYVQNTSYQEITGAYQVTFMVENNSSQNIYIEMNNVSVDDFMVSIYSGASTINAGKKRAVNFSIRENDYIPYGIKNFSTWEGTLTVNGNNTICQKLIQIDKLVFDEVTSASTEDAPVTANTTESDSEESDIEARLSALEKSNMELEEKNQKLEQDNKELDEQIKKLEEENAELKNQAGQKDTPEEIEPADTPTSAESTEETTLNEVVEYKDATTIRIVQQALNEAGYNCGTPDGVAGGNTSAAITKFQTEKGITVNGLVTDELLQALGVVEKVQDAVEKEAAKAEYSSEYTYDQLARNPDTYKSQKMKFTGTVVQEGDAGDGLKYVRLKINSNYDTILFITYLSSLLDYRLLEDDSITVYGTSCGVYSYKSTMGATITIPWIHADIIEM